MRSTRWEATYWFLYHHVAGRHFLLFRPKLLVLTKKYINALWYPSRLASTALCEWFAICWSSINMIKSIELITKAWMKLSSNTALYHDQWVLDMIKIILTCGLRNNQPVGGTWQYHPHWISELYNTTDLVILLMRFLMRYKWVKQMFMCWIDTQ